MNDNKNLFGLTIILTFVIGLPAISQVMNQQANYCPKATSIIEVKDSDINAGEPVNWTNDNTYLLDGYVFAEDGATLNIEPGTVIKAKRTPTTGDMTSALIISRGAKIYARGTQDNPIIFTSEQDDVNLPDYDPADGVDFSIDGGLWGGVVLLGKGDVNVADEMLMEGLPDDAEKRGYYGGTDDSDNSGAIQYTSIRYAGAQAVSAKRLPGLTLAAIGSGTTLDHIETFNAYEDGFLLLGGAPNTSHMATSFPGDDSFEYDKGFRGNHQFWFALQHANWGNHQCEAEGGDEGNLTATPLSQPVIFNTTFIGSGVNSGNTRAVHVLSFHEYAGGEQYNGIFTDFPEKAVFVEAGAGPRSEDLLGTNLKIESNIWWKEAGNSWDDLIDRYSTINHISNNNNTLTDPQLKGISRTNDNGLDPRPDANGPATTLDRKAYPTGFFQEVDYMGAFNPNEENTWLHGWTALDQCDILKAAQSIEEIVSKPGTPTGDNDIFENTNHEYATTGAESNLGNIVEYSFNWGDGSTSAWSEEKSAEHEWNTTGNYGIFVVARSQADTTKTNTSDTLDINVKEDTAVEDPNHQPAEYRLNQNYPNPFNPITNISYTLKKPVHVTLSIYNLKGQTKKILVNQQQNQGAYKVKLDASDFAAGLYLYVIKAGPFTQSRKMLLMK